jgi:hypothetical protein
MAKLSDIIPPQHRIVINVAGEGEQEVDVRGLNLQDIAGLMSRYPEVIEQFDGKLDALAILKLGPQVVAAIMAMACGAPGDRGAEAALLALPLGKQAEILNIVVRETMPNGVGPFVELLKALGLDLDTVRRKVDSAKPSLSPSTTSAPMDTTSVQ